MNVRSCIGLLLSLLLAASLAAGCGQGGGMMGGTLGGGAGTSPLTSTGPETSVVEGQISFTHEGKSYSGTADKNGYFFISLEDPSARTLDIKVTYGTLSDTCTVNVLEKGSSQVAQTARWGIHLYLNGNNDLEEFCVENLRELEKTGYSQNVYPVVALSRQSLGGVCDILLVRRPDQVPEVLESGVVCGRVLRKESKLVVEQFPSSSLLLAHWEKVDMAKPESLAAFTELASAKLPSVYSLFLVASHGGGYRNVRTGYQYISYDALSDSVLNVNELKAALGLMKTKAHVLGLDTCCGGNIETAWQVRDSLNPKKAYLLASPNLLAPEGWPYGTIIETLRENGTYDPQMLCTFIAKTFASHHRSKGDDSQVLCAYDLAKLKDLAAPLEELSARLVKEASQPGGIAMLKSVRSAVKAMGDADLVDMGNLLELIIAQNNERLTAPARKAADALGAVVAARGASAEKSGEAGGLAIFFPARISDTGVWKDMEGNAYESLDFSSSRGVPTWHRLISLFNNNLVPIIMKMKPSNGFAGTKVNLEGWFGGEKGTLTVGGKESPVAQWSETMVTFPIPREAGAQEVCVTVAGNTSNGVLLNVEK